MPLDGMRGVRERSGPHTCRSAVVRRSDWSARVAAMGVPVPMTWVRVPLRPQHDGAETGAAPLRLLQIVGFVSTLDRFAMAPMLIAIAADLRAPLASVVGAAGAYFLAYGLSQPVWGVVADRVGRVRTIRLTLLLAGLLTAGSAAVGSPAALAITR